jgi:drug/metabolite transporter (DMT)-like permease
VTPGTRRRGHPGRHDRGGGRADSGLGFGLALVSAATFGTSGTFARALIEAGWSAEAAVTARVGVGSLLLVAPAVLALRGRWPVLRRNLGAIGLFGVLAVTGGQVSFFNAVRYLPVGVALLLEYLAVILVVCWMWGRHGQRPHRLTAAGAVAAAAGLVLVLDLTGGARVDPIGVLWGMGAAVGLAAYFVLSAHVDAQLPSVVMASGSMALSCALLLLLGVSGALPLDATFDEVIFAGHRMSWLVPALGLTLIAGVVSYVSGIGAARILGARLSSFVGLTEVMFAVLVAWLVLGELPTVVQALGGTLILAGVVLVRVDEVRPRRVRRPRQHPVSDSSGERLER